MGRAYRIRLGITARGNETDEQIGEAQRSVSAISPIALVAELKRSVVLAQRDHNIRWKSRWMGNVVARSWIFQSAPLAFV